MPSITRLLSLPVMTVLLTAPRGALKHLFARTLEQLLGRRPGELRCPGPRLRPLCLLQECHQPADGSLHRARCPQAPARPVGLGAGCHLQPPSEERPFTRMMMTKMATAPLRCAALYSLGRTSLIDISFHLSSQPGVLRMICIFQARLGEGEGMPHPAGHQDG